MPSSTAYLARKGGASAVAVAASSETTDNAVRTLYGLVSRASSAMRPSWSTTTSSASAIVERCGDAQSNDPDHRPPPLDPDHRPPPLVSQRDRREAVGDDQGRSIAHRLAQADADPRFGGGVYRGG